MLLPHPYAGDETVRLDAWGQLNIALEMPEETVSLFSVEWNLDDLAEWFADHKSAIANEAFPFHELNCSPASEESLAESLNRCSPVSPEVFEEQFLQRLEVLQGYASRHSLWSALPGIQMPAMVVGRNRGEGEISVDRVEAYQDMKGWAYAFDMDDFCTDLTEELRRFLLAWIATSNDPDVIERASSIRARLDA
jgi:hypothetical protein